MPRHAKNCHQVPISITSLFLEGAIFIRRSFGLFCTVGQNHTINPPQFYSLQFLRLLGHIYTDSLVHECSKFINPSWWCEWTTSLRSTL